ncbi:sterol carrier family protein [Solicola gregarius]|uniref:Sterol carrier family protein n=1 Tax=Solicola gregarius TaxID=2908642 RepID=A0AA46YIT8_9ACTN|nr:sterol carrier family protein [Solicola gregarius]UYM03525.1 sterol carrier family protein [Solicola gregarius]
MPVRLTPLAPEEFEPIRERIENGTADRSDLRAATKHLLAVLAEKEPGHSVEVRVPPYAAVQCIPGARHTRGTPPAVVEMDAPTWIALALGREDWVTAVRDGRVVASGERSDLSAYLPV